MYIIYKLFCREQLLLSFLICKLHCMFTFTYNIILNLRKIMKLTSPVNFQTSLILNPNQKFFFKAPTNNNLAPKLNT